MDLIIPEWNAQLSAKVGALSTTRCGGFSLPPYDDGAGGGGLNLGIHVGDDPEHVFRNRALLRSHLPAEPLWLTQVHGVNVADASVAEQAAQADAVYATRPGVVCAIQTADCLPILFCDIDGAVVAAAHAGWRGLAHGVVEATVAGMRESGARDILAWLGPAIGPACFEVGQDVFDAFVDQDRQAASLFAPIKNHPGKYLADIYGLARLRLNALGIVKISGGGFCTVSDRRRFYSYRRDQRTGRMASLIWLK